MFEGFPFIVGWELTLACNLGCAHCGSSAGIARKGELSLKEALCVSDQFSDLLVQEVNFTGGEPLMYPGWDTLAKRLVARGMAVKILTNGLLLSRDTVSQMKDVGISGVGVSIDGPKRTHDSIRRRPGSFAAAIRGVEYALKKNLAVTVITTVNALNVDELSLLGDILVSSGIERWQVQPLFPLGRGSSSDMLHLSDNAYCRFGEFVRAVMTENIFPQLEFLPGDSFGYFTDYDVRQPPWRGCPAGLCSVGITSDGKVKGCLSLPDEVTEGDLRRKDLWTIWFSPESFPYTRNYSREKLGPNCALCDKADDCRGGCSAMSYGSTGRFRNDPYCFYRIRSRESSAVQIASG